LTPPRLRLATRGSPLALAQTALVARLLREASARAGAADLEVEPVVVRTEGDRRPDADLDRLGGQGVFVKEVQAAVLDGGAEAAVHSAKDLPPATPPGLRLASVPDRADPRDALVGRALDELGAGAVVATGSARRRAQLANLRPDLLFVGLRGNMDRRVERAAAGDVDAVVAAACALDRLGRGARVAQRLPLSWCLPQVGQGALAVECREDDARTAALLAAIDAPDAHRALAAERAFLRALGAGCRLPVAGRAGDLDGGAERDGRAAGSAPAPRLRLQGMMASGDGRVVVRDELSGDDPDELGRALARLLVTGRGASSLEGFDLRAFEVAGAV
jgi:hydroxymethylbilane synthase